MWYENNYRRHLIDMHIDDWNDEFLSQFDPDAYVNNLINAKVQNAMIYLQSHVGLCNFPTKTGVMHKAFVNRENTIRDLIDKCHANGIAVTAYYSLNYNTIEHDRHPDWRLVHASGISRRDGGTSKEKNRADQLLFASPQKARYGLCCPNNPDYRKFTYAQIDEMLDYCGDIEGVFFDMPFWDYTCYCPECRKKWAKEVGGEMPENFQFGDKTHQTVMRKKTDWMGEFIQSVTDYVKKSHPNLSVEHNYASAVAVDTDFGCAEEVNNASDFVGGDLYGGIINHSFACKLYKNITKNMPFDYMFSRCKPGLTCHTLTKTDDEIRTEVFMNVAHHGATLVIDAIDPVGTMDERFYNKMGKIFAEEIPYEKYLNGKMVEDIGLYFSLMSKFNSHGEDYDNLKSLITVSSNFIERKIPYGVTGNFHTLDGYKAIVLSLVTEMEKDFDRIIKYVEDGGNLYISGTENPKLLHALTGLEVVGRTEENPVYLAPNCDDVFLYFNKKYPLHFNGTAPIVKASKPVEVLATLNLPYTTANEFRFASIHSNPPGINTDYPAIIKTKLKKGNIIWSAVPIESVNIYEYKEIFNNLLSLLLTDYKPSFKCNSSDGVELTLFDHGDYLTLNVANVNEVPVSKVVNTFDAYVKVENVPKGVFLLPDNTPVDFTYAEGYVSFKVENFKIFQMYKIEK